MAKTTHLRGVLQAEFSSFCGLLSEAAPNCGRGEWQPAAHHPVRVEAAGQTVGQHVRRHQSRVRGGLVHSVLFGGRREKRNSRGARRLWRHYQSASVGFEYRELLPRNRLICDDTGSMNLDIGALQSLFLATFLIKDGWCRRYCLADLSIAKWRNGKGL